MESVKVAASRKKKKFSAMMETVHKLEAGRTGWVDGVGMKRVWVPKGWRVVTAIEGLMLEGEVEEV